MTTRSIRRSALACILLGIIHIPTPVLGAPVNWLGGMGPQWDTPGNWFPATPTMVDDAIFSGAGTPIFLNTGLDAAGNLNFNSNGYMLLGNSLNLGNPAANINVDDGNGLSEINATLEVTINNFGGINKMGADRLTLLNANNISGSVTVSAGYLNIRNNLALGALGSTQVLSGATLEIQSDIIVTDESLTLTGSGASSLGALRNVSGKNNFNGNITLNGATLIYADAGRLGLSPTSGNAISGLNTNLTFGGSGDFTVSQPVALGNGTLFKEGIGRLTLSALNPYNGATVINGGFLKIQHGGALGTLSTTTIVSAGATLELEGGITVNSEPLTIDGTGPSSEGALRNVAGNNQFNGTITLVNSTSIMSDAGKLTINPSVGDAIVSGPVDFNLGGDGDIEILKTINIDSSALSKFGAGKLTLTAINPYTGPTFVTGGTLIVNGNNTASNMTIATSGGTLSGTGEVGNIYIGLNGILAPGESTGILDAFNTTFDSAIFSVEIFGTTLGTEYDQLNATGTVTISSNTQLIIELGLFNPADDGSQTFTIINNDLADALTLTGKFASGIIPLNEGDLFSADGQNFTISYAGGDGNDVVLTAVPEPASTILMMSGLVGALGLRRRRNLY